MLIGLIDGVLLGDGFISRFRGNGSSYFEITQKVEHNDFILTIENELKKHDIRSRVFELHRLNKKTLNNGHYLRLVSKSNPQLRKLREIWYPENIKIIPETLMLDSTSIAYWFMCDGSTTYYKQTKDQVRITLATECFKKTDIFLLIKELKRLGINSLIAKAGSGYNINIYKSIEVIKFLNLISEHIFPSFRYKMKYPDR